MKDVIVWDAEGYWPGRYVVGGFVPNDDALPTERYIVIVRPYDTSEYWARVPRR